MKAEQIALPADHPLWPYVFGVWKLTDVAAGHRERILPRGTVDLLFPLSGRIMIESAEQDAPPVLTDAPFVAGIQRQAVTTVTLETTTLLGVSLRAELASAILPLPARELSGAVVEGALIWRQAGEAFSRLYAAKTFTDQTRIVLQWIGARVRPDVRRHDVGHACSVLTRTPTEACGRAVASALSVSPRHLRRLFLDHVGMTPQHYVRLRRFNRALALMPSTRNLTTIAQESHYYDQAHLCHDFQSIAGMTPREYRAQAGPVEGLVFSDDVRVIQVPERAVF